MSVRRAGRHDGRRHCDGGHFDQTSDPSSSPDRASTGFSRSSIDSDKGRRTCDRIFQTVCVNCTLHDEKSQDPVLISTALGVNIVILRSLTLFSSTSSELFIIMLSPYIFVFLLLTRLAQSSLEKVSAQGASLDVSVFLLVLDTTTSSFGQFFSFYKGWLAAILKPETTSRTRVSFDRNNRQSTTL